MLEHSPVTVPLAELLPQLKAEGYAVLDAVTVAQWAQHPLNELTALVPDWEGMPEDAYLKDGGHYRLRRHSCFVFENDQLALAPARAHWHRRARIRAQRSSTAKEGRCRSGSLSCLSRCKSHT
jgi:hypothetical protein